MEQIYREGRRGPRHRAFSISAGVSCSRYSRALQRVILDFGADKSFGKIPQKLKEHYGITVPISSGQVITERHAQKIFQQQELKTEIPEKTEVEVMICEMDGSMVPIVETRKIQDDEKVDRRKDKKVHWKEARLSLARAKGEVTPIFGATMGKPEEAGAQLVNSAIVAGIGKNTKVHGVGDGAPWIAEQIDSIFGMQATYLVDFYHLCEYLSAAGDVCAPEDKSWMEQQKERMKNNESSEVLKALKPYLESETVPNKDAPVRACNRYITNRLRQFDYKGALEAKLPIGSGEVESAHRYVIQQRLKISGAWWKIENAQNMIALRVLRENNDWETSWDSVRQEAA